MRPKVPTRFLIVTVVLVVVGAAYEQAGRWRDHKRFPQIGRSVDIGGRSLNIYCSGEGSPAVVFDSGGVMPGYSWVSIQREISKSALSCWYDRAGYGWSDPGPFPRTSVTAANDLHALLGVAHVGPPYVLVGHSLGGFNVRVYAGLYPDEVVGVVLVDPSHEDVDARIPRGRALLHMPSQLRPAFRMLILTSKRIGLLRLLGRRHESDHPSAGMTPTEWATIQGLAAMPNTTEASMEGENSAEQARAAGDLGNRPLVVLTAGTPTRVRSETIARPRRIRTRGLNSRRNWLVYQRADGK